MRPLDHMEALAEAGDGREEPIKAPVSHQLIPASQRDQDPLPDVARVAEGFHDLEVLVGPATLVTTLDSDEHARSTRNPKPASRESAALISILGTRFWSATTSGHCKRTRLLRGGWRLEVETVEDDFDMTGGLG